MFFVGLLHARGLKIDEFSIYRIVHLPTLPYIYWCKKKFKSKINSHMIPMPSFPPVPPPKLRLLI
jgi:hypothetical protein